MTIPGRKVKAPRPAPQLRLPDPRALPIALKLAIVLAIVLLITGLITDTVVRQVIADGQREVVLEDLHTLSRSNAFRMVDVLGQEIVYLNRLSTSPIVQDQLKALLASEEDVVAGGTDVLEAQVSSFRQTHPEFDAVVLLDYKGKVDAMNPASRLEVTKDPAKSLWFTGALGDGTGTTYISSPQDDRLTGYSGIHIALPIYDNAKPDEIIGVVYGIWNMSNILDITQVGSQREGLVLEADGSVLISPSNERGESFPRDLTTNFREKAAGSFTYSDKQGSRWLYGYVTLKDLGLADQSVTNLGWTVAVRQPAGALTGTVATLTDRLRLAIGGSALAVTLVVAIFTIILLSPLRRLTRAAVLLQRGDLSAPIPQLPSDEVGRLAALMRSLVAQLLERLNELRVAVQVSHATALTLDMNQMLDDVARSLTQQFAYPDVRIYLTDPSGRRAFIQAASGAEGERLLRSGHRLAVDETTLIGRAMLLGEPQIGAEREQLREAGLMTGRSELAIPLQSGSRALGAVHVLARRMGEFLPEDVDILRLIADQLSASIANARLFEQSQASLAEIEALNRRLTREAWEEYLDESGTLRHTPDPEANWPTNVSLVQQGEVVKGEIVIDEDGRSVLAVPLILRGEAVGSLAVTRPVGERWSREEVILLESIASRMSMIAEGIRLVDESNRRALREQRVNDVSANLLARATSVESVLRNALNELGGALGSDRVSLRIGKIPVDAEPTLTTDGVIEFRSKGDREDNGHQGPNGGSTNGSLEEENPGIGDGDLSDV